MAVNTEFLNANYAPKWNWELRISGYAAARFLSGDRPKATFEVMEVNPGGTHRAVKQPGRLSFDDLTFEAGEIVSAAAGDFITWMEECLSFADGVSLGNVPATLFRNVELVEFDTRDQEIGKWTLHGAFISAYDGNDVDGSSSDTKTESITLTYQYFTRKK